MPGTSATPPHHFLVPGHRPRTAQLPGARGLKKGALSAFIEDAMRRQLFEQTVEAIKDRNAGIDPNELMELIDATIRVV
jgi:hypothetical protein